jgi:Ni,Fe-hydrogenase III small subunit
MEETMIDFGGVRLTFRLDKHKQLRITANADFEANPKEPDILILTQDETEELRTLLQQNYETYGVYNG